MAYYQQHIFFCTNLRKNKEKCCGQADAEDMYAYAKSYLKSINVHGKDKIRVSSSGCLGRCKQGPCLVIYPIGKWYAYSNKQDLQRILEEVVLKKQEIIELSIDSPNKNS